MSLTITRTSEIPDPPLVLNQITEGEVFIFIEGPGPSGATKNIPCMLSDEQSYMYLNSGILHSINGRVGNRPVKRITCELTW